MSVLFIIYFLNKYPSDMIKYFYRLLVLMLNQLSTILLVKMLQWHHAEQLLFIVIYCITTLMYWFTYFYWKEHTSVLTRSSLTDFAWGSSILISICRRIPLIFCFFPLIFFFTKSHTFSVWKLGSPAHLFVMVYTSEITRCVIITCIIWKVLSIAFNGILILY